MHCCAHLCHLSCKIWDIPQFVARMQFSERFHAILQCGHFSTEKSGQNMIYFSFSKRKIYSLSWRLWNGDIPSSLDHFKWLYFEWVKSTWYFFFFIWLYRPLEVRTPEVLLSSSIPRAYNSHIDLIQWLTHTYFYYIDHIDWYKFTQKW